MKIAQAPLPVHTPVPEGLAPCAFNHLDRSLKIDCHKKISLFRGPAKRAPRGFRGVINLDVFTIAGCQELVKCAVLHFTKSKFKGLEALCAGKAQN
ncbi:MAG: hypothetical protein K2X27_02740, partial [Candidatus Obscuribacterales bacterium]|nr:hypothetical protein [Candidatus Obscuribacterales bacterium]